MRLPALSGDYLGVVEASHRFDLPEREWLLGVLTAARPMLDRGGPLAAFVFDATALPMTVGTTVGIDYPNVELEVPSMLAATQPHNIERTFRGPRLIGTLTSVLGRKTLEADTVVMESWRRVGVRDVFGAQCVDPTRRGVVLSAGLRVVAHATAHDLAVWGRMAAHVAGAYRLRKQGIDPKLLDGAGVEAVLTPAGRVDHAVGPPKAAEAREALKRATLAIDRASGRLRKREPERALGLWRGMVEGRWSLVAQFDTDGRRYLVARRNDPRVPRATAPALTERERQVVGYVCLGHANKVIAYALGVTESTVAAHLGQALRKLRLPSRSALIQASLALARAETPPDR